MKRAMILILAIALDACNSPETSPSAGSQQSAAPKDVVAFGRLIAEIAGDVPDLGAPDFLFGSHAFMLIYENPVPHFASAIAFMTSPDVNAHQKKITAYGMQRLPRDKFVSFVSTIVGAVEQGATEVEVLECAAFPTKNWGKQPLIVHYQDPMVRPLLERIMVMEQLSPGRRAYVHDKILTGQARTDYLSYLDMMGRQFEE